MSRGEGNDRSYLFFGESTCLLRTSWHSLPAPESDEDSKHTHTQVQSAICKVKTDLTLLDDGRWPLSMTTNEKDRKEKQQPHRYWRSLTTYSLHPVHRIDKLFRHTNRCNIMTRHKAHKLQTRGWSIFHSGLETSSLRKQME